MNKILLGAALVSISPLPVHAAVVMCMGQVCTGSETNNLTVVSNCTSQNTKCYGNNIVVSCDICKTGYTRTPQSATGPGCSNTITWYNCEYNSSGGGGDTCDGTCDNCLSTSWTAADTGYQSRTKATCNTTTCKCSTSREYRCAAGYYGSPPAIQQIGSLTGCTRCPASGVRFGNSAVGSTTITSCYLATGTGISDTTGTFTYTSNCYYTE